MLFDIQIEEKKTHQMSKAKYNKMFQSCLVLILALNESTIMILSFWTDWSGQIGQTQIRQLLEEQSGQGLHCLLFHLHLFDEIPLGLATLFEF